VRDREKWKDIFRQAKTHSRLQCQWKKKNKKNLCVFDTHFNIIPPLILPSQMVTSPRDSVKFDSCLYRDFICIVMLYFILSHAVKVCC
jgi:hypothetical protein